MDNNGAPTKETCCCVDWMSDISVWTFSNQATRCGIRSSMKASTSKGYARPDHQRDRDYLKSNREGLKREEDADLIKANQGGNHHDQPENGYELQHPYSTPSVGLAGTERRPSA